ncbi:MAG: flagellar biosynthesis anti-sigma factor FlgM [Firmicutes bacterium]|nr:flagellar biosynthesis anti-sigma factor FlgM [Bacillota bacterium]
MRIPGNFSKIISIYNKNKKVVNTDETKGIKGKKDVVSLSRQARDHQSALKAVRQCPDVREERVKALERKLAGGTYNVTGEDVADKLINKFIDKKI